MSSETRRMKVASSHTGEGGMPICFRLAKTSSSTKFFAGGRCFTGAPSGIETLQTAAMAWKRTITATLPGMSRVFTRPDSPASAMARSLAS